MARKRSMAKLRRVTFHLNEADGFHPNLSEVETNNHDETTRERDGFFHCWTDVEERSPQSGKFIEITEGLIEECGTGTIYYVKPNLIQFKVEDHEQE